MDGFELNDAGTHYEQTVGFNAENTKPSSIGNNVELVYSVQNEAKSQNSQGRTIYLSDHKNIHFSCSYSLDTQEVSTELDVTGTDIAITRAKTGKLYFKMIGSPSINIGARYSFDIVPTTPGAVFYTTKNCKVKTADEKQSYNLIYPDDNGNQCTDKVTDVQLVSNAWSTSDTATFEYDSFKFANPAGRGSVDNES